MRKSEMRILLSSQSDTIFNLRKKVRRLERTVDDLTCELGFQCRDSMLKSDILSEIHEKIERFKV